MKRHCENITRGQIKLIACEAGKPFAQKIAKELENLCLSGVTGAKPKTKTNHSMCEGGKLKEDNIIVPSKETHFANTEIKTEIEASIRGSNVFIVQDVENSRCGKYFFNYDKLAEFVNQENTKTEFIRLFEEEFKFRPEKIDVLYSELMKKVSYKNDWKPFNEHLKKVKQEQGEKKNAYVDLIKKHEEKLVNQKYENFESFLEKIGNLLAPLDFFVKHSVNDNYTALKTAIDAASEADAHYITAVIPVFPFARQDKTLSREGITAKMVAEELENAGANRVITMDIHNQAIKGFFNKVKVENLYASRNLIPAIEKQIGFNNLLYLSPDAGGASRARQYANKSGAKMALIHKEKDYSQPSKISVVTLVGEVKNLNIVIVDDMMATGNSIDAACRTVHKNEASQISICVSLPILNTPAIRILDELYREKILHCFVTTNAVYHGENFAEQRPYYHEVPVEDIFAEAIFSLSHNQSISRLFD